MLLELVGVTLGALVSLPAEQDLLQMIKLYLLGRGNDPELSARRGRTLKDHKLAWEPGLLSVQVHNTIGVIRIPGLNRRLRDALGAFVSGDQPPLGLRRRMSR